MDKISAKQAIGYLTRAKERLQNEYKERLEDLEHNRKTIYQHLDLMPVDAYQDAEKYLGYVNVMKQFLEEQLKSIEKWELAKLFLEEKK